MDEKAIGDADELPLDRGSKEAAEIEAAVDAVEAEACERSATAQGVDDVGDEALPVGGGPALA